MYATIEKNRLHISVSEYYSSSWYGKNWPLSREEKFWFEYGNLEIDIYKNGKKYLTGFVIDPRRFIVDYLKTRYKKDLAQPKKIESVTIDANKHFDMFCVDFLKCRSFVVDRMEKDLIFPQFCRQKGQIKIQGFEVLDIFSIIKYLVKRFKYKGTTRIRKGNTAHDLTTRRKWKIERKKKS